MINNIFKLIEETEKSKINKTQLAQSAKEIAAYVAGGLSTGLATRLALMHYDPEMAEPGIIPAALGLVSAGIGGKLAYNLVKKK
jgi:hypothetical protein